LISAALEIYDVATLHLDTWDLDDLIDLISSKLLFFSLLVFLLFSMAVSNLVYNTIKSV